MHGPICANVKLGLQAPSAIKQQAAETGPNCQRFGLQFRPKNGRHWECGHWVSLHRGSTQGSTSRPCHLPPCPKPVPSPLSPSLQSPRPELDVLCFEQPHRPNSTTFPALSNRQGLVRSSTARRGTATAVAVANTVVSRVRGWVSLVSLSAA